MATKGLRHPVYAIYSESTGAPIYSGGAVAGYSTDVSVTYDKGDAKGYGDDRLLDADNAISGGTITAGIYGISLADRAILLGHTTAESPAIGFTGNGDDNPPFVGYGFYGPNTDGTWRAFWYNKVIFAEPNDALTTRAGKTEYKSEQLSGAFTLDINNDWGEIQEFATEAAAKAWLDDKAGITVKCVKPVANKAAGTYTGTQSVTLTAGAGEAIYYTTNGITPSAANGTLYSSAISIAESCALRAIATKSLQSDSDIATYEYIIEA